MANGTVSANGLTLWYETFGAPTDPAIILIMGLSGQATLWPVAFCQQLATGGHFVVRFDNRDVGHSQRLADDQPYTLADMADDTVGLLDALGVDRAHVVG